MKHFIDCCFVTLVLFAMIAVPVIVMVCLL